MSEPWGNELCQCVDCIERGFDCQCSCDLHDSPCMGCVESDKVMKDTVFISNEMLGRN